MSSVAHGGKTNSVVNSPGPIAWNKMANYREELQATRTLLNQVVERIENLHSSGAQTPQSGRSVVPQTP